MQQEINFLQTFQLITKYPDNLEELLENKFNCVQPNFLQENEFKSYLLEILDQKLGPNCLIKQIDDNNELGGMEVKFTRKAIFQLLLLMYLEIVERPNSVLFYDNFKILNKSNKYGLPKQKKLCFLNYFYSFYQLRQQIEIEIVTYSFIRPKQQIQFHELGNNQLKRAIFTQDPIEDQQQSIILDFADRKIGGLTLDSFNCAQEEIEMLIHPEALISVLFMDIMNNDNAILFENLIRYNFYLGYEQYFQLIKGIENDNIQRINMLAIDATQYGNTYIQFQMNEVQREYKKCYIGYKYSLDKHPNLNISSGKWGCGIFRGNVYLKYIIQLLAFTEVTNKANNQQSQFIFSCFKDHKGQKELENFQEAIQQHKLTNQQLYSILQNCQNEHDLIDSIENFDQTNMQFEKKNKSNKYPKY